MDVTLTCYGQIFGQYPYRIGKAVMLRHIWACPKGAMPWARRVRFVYADGLHAWATAANGAWLNHVLWQVREVCPSDPDGECSALVQELDRLNDAFWQVALRGGSGD